MPHTVIRRDSSPRHPECAPQSLPFRLKIMRLYISSFIMIFIYNLVPLISEHTSWLSFLNDDSQAYDEYAAGVCAPLWQDCSAPVYISCDLLTQRLYTGFVIRQLSVCRNELSLVRSAFIHMSSDWSPRGLYTSVIYQFGTLRDYDWSAQRLYAGVMILL